MKQVLIVDNHRLFRRVLGIVLKHNTDLKETLEANSLAEARPTLGNSIHKPALAVVNLNLTNGEGFELMSELRTSAPDVPVLAITLSRDAERREQALRAGAGEVLTMDTSPKKIVDVAKQLVGE